MNKHIVKSDNVKLEIRFYKNVVRVTYKKLNKKYNNDLIELENNLEKKQFNKKNNIIYNEQIKVEILDDLKIKIYDDNDNLLLEDREVKINFNKNKENEKSLVDHLVKKEKEEVEIIHKRKYLNESGFYGLGEKYGNLNFLNRDTINFNTDVLAVAPVHISTQREYHTSIPFYIGIDKNKTYGIYYHNTYKSYFDFNKSNDGITYKSEGGKLDYFFIIGDNIDEVVKNYSMITGTMELPNKSFLGYQQCRWSYKNKDHLMKVARRMYKENIPCDVLYLDIDYMDNYKVFTIDSKDFKEFSKMVDELHEMGYKLVTIIDPGIKKEKGYFVYDECIKNEYYLKDKDDKAYVGEVWPGDSIFPDFTRKKVRDWWGDLHQVLIKLGVDGIWNDMNEIADFSTESKTVPIDTYHIDDNGKKRLQKEVHNIYGHLESKSTYNALKKHTDNRPFVLTRSAFSGTQKYAALWTGDNASIWEHLENAIPMMINLSLSGYNFIGADMGGFLEDTNGELLTRWVQFGIFTPLFRNHSALNTKFQEPWQFGENYLNIIKKFIKLRYKLTPHIYNLLKKSSETGKSILKPLFYYEYNEKTLDINDGFIFGDNVLVYPIYKPRIKKKMVYLPEGTWYNFFNDKKYKGDQYHIIDVDIDTFPMFVKEGSIIPMRKDNFDLESKNSQLDIHIYEGKDNSYQLYLDDGETFNYKEGEYSLIDFELKNNKLDIDILKDDYNVPKFNIIKHS
ncbi:MAG: TIM-barrel domain-containing protein [Bacillota bacterium]